MLSIPPRDGCDRLAGEVAALSGENKTDAVIQALQERLAVASIGLQTGHQHTRP